MHCLRVSKNPALSNSYYADTFLHNYHKYCRLLVSSSIFQQTVIYLLVAVGYLAASSLVLSVVVSYSETQYSWLPSSTKHHLIATTVLEIYFPINSTYLLIIKVLKCY